MNNYIYIIDYSALPEGALYRIVCDEEDKNSNVNAIFDKYGLNPDECSWIFSDYELSVEDIKPYSHE